MCYADIHAGKAVTHRKQKYKVFKRLVARGGDWVAQLTASLGTVRSVWQEQDVFPELYKSDDAF